MTNGPLHHHAGFQEREDQPQYLAVADTHKGRSATDRVAARIAALLNDPNCVRDYRHLFELRSTFVHGRAGVQKVSTVERVMARSLARRVARGLVSAAAPPSRARETILADLLDQGAQYL